jgi:hypothetical protein
VVIQILGLSVDHTVYLVQLLPLNSKPDTLTLYDLRYSPILHQIPLMTRQWLDFAWIQRTGPNAVDLPPLLAALVGVGGALVGFALVWSAKSRTRRLLGLALASALVAGGTIQALRVYSRQIEPAMAAVVNAFERTPADTAVVQMIPNAVIPFANWQKRDLPELGWIEEAAPSPLIRRRLARLEASSGRVWVVTAAPAKSPGNGVEVLLDRSLVQYGDETIGPFRLLRYATQPQLVHFVDHPTRFGDGIELVGYATPNAPARPGQTLDVVLAWRAGSTPVAHPDLTVFVHLVDDGGALIAQHDDPPASGYLPTSGWLSGQLVYDDHSIALPANAPSGAHQVQVGLYLPATGQRVPLLGPDGNPAGDTVTLEVSIRA